MSISLRFGSSNSLHCELRVECLAFSSASRVMPKVPSLSNPFLQFSKVKCRRHEQETTKGDWSICWRFGVSIVLANGSCVHRNENKSSFVTHARSEGQARPWHPPQKLLAIPTPLQLEFQCLSSTYSKWETPPRVLTRGISPTVCPILGGFPLEIEYQGRSNPSNNL